MLSCTRLGLVLALSIAASSLGPTAAAGQSSAAKPKSPKKPAATVAEPRAPEPAPPPPTDVRIHTRYVNGPQVSENTTYMKGVRQRVEFPGMTLITQCDLNRTVQLHDGSKHFMVVPSDFSAATPAGTAQAAARAQPGPAAVQAAGPAGGASAKPQGGVITETVTLTDTGERKRMFGLEARHVTTRVVREPGANACDARNTTVETDGWYADLPERAVCPSVPVSAPAPSQATEACVDRVERRQVGDARMGVALSTTITTTVDDRARAAGAPGSATSPGPAAPGAPATPGVPAARAATVSMSVTELEITTLPDALFDVPAGYTEVKSYQELLPSLANGGSLADAVFGSLADGSSMVAPKQPGVTRIGIVDPVDKSGRSLPIAMLRGALIGSLTHGPFEALPVAGATPADLDRDATAKAADFILVTEIGEVKTSKAGKIGSVLRHVSGDANPGSDVYEARVDYKLYAIGEQTRPRVAASARASSGTSFGVGSALKVASFAGSMYMSTMTGGMFGLSPFGASPFGALGGSPFGGLGAFSALSHVGLAAPAIAASAGSIAGGLSGRAAPMSSGMSVVHPGMGAAMAIMAHGAGSIAGVPGLADPSAQKAAQVIEDALAKEGKEIADELGKSKRP